MVCSGRITRSGSQNALLDAFHPFVPNLLGEFD
jgi:hypothetical protein